MELVTKMNESKKQKPESSAESSFHEYVRYSGEDMEHSDQEGWLWNQMGSQILTRLLNQLCDHGQIT